MSDALEIIRLDHLALTVADVERTVAFYERVLGMRAVTFGEGRRALAFGESKINLHEVGRELLPRTGALGPILSTYLRDPDGNLIEISTYGETADCGS